MKNPMQKFRRFFFRGKKYNASTARATTAHGYDDDDNDNGHRLSGAFVAVLILHVIAIVGVFAFARVREKEKSKTPPQSAPTTAAAKPHSTKPKPAKPAVEIPAVTAPVATTNPAPATIKTPQTGHRTTYIVKTDDSLTRIAFAFKVGVDDIITANNLKNRDDIKAGQPLTIPDSKPVSKLPPAAEMKATATTPPAHKSPTPGSDTKTPKTYIVKKNDTAVKIARENRCTYEELVKLNNIKDPKKIQSGQVLKLPPKSF